MIALHGRYQCQSYTRVATGWLDDGGSWFQYAFLLGILYHGECNAVFHASAWIEELYFSYYWGVETLRS